ncbi:MAG: tRNA (adenosine(37)-N6)-threonylcarbamoyltransferase complex ATPase subunit type 1 TsaE [Acidobacteria bacterium]|nr:tRNA (adenosine(37)-N6)-threonylcarbamoyltransferase complex ATPase subunit type 1 TsaE [Acidobacteriota bacterium]
METYYPDSEEAMIALGEQIAGRLPSRCVVFLTGNLGAGKTTLSKGIAAGMGVATPEEVSSPTFTLIHEYGEPTRLYHIDLYRLDEPRQLMTLGLDEIFDRDAVVLLEWPEKFARWLPKPDVEIRIEREDGRRRVTLSHTMSLI